MKKMKSMRVAAVLLALVMITSCFVGNTFAKYTTAGEGKANARVAKFGVVINADPSEVFKTDYNKKSGSTFTGTYSVSAETPTSGTRSYVVAPGTEGDAMEFSVSGKPEVAVHVDFTVSDANCKDIFLAGGKSYTDDTTASKTDSFTLTDDYYPVAFTLMNGTTKVVDAGTMDDVITKLEGFSGDFAPGTDLSNVLGDYSLTWEWAFDGNDQADTLLGNLAAGMNGTANPGYAGAEPVAPTTTGGSYTYAALTADTDYCLNLVFEFSITVTQID